MNETQQLAEFAATVRLSDIPPAVVEHTKALILDQIGCQILGSQVPWCENVYAAVCGLAGVGSSGVVMRDTRLPLDEAVFVNSTFGHGVEIDDAHTAVRTHPGAVVVPVALNLSELTAVSGADLLLATIVGYEVMIRVCDASMPDLMEVRHHHTPAAAGPFGAAACASRLMGFDAATSEHALAIAGSHSGGLMQYTQSGGSVKRIHCALAAKSGVRAAVLAQHGVTGPAEVLEGKRGFLRGFAGAEDSSKLTNELGTTYLTSGVGIKRHRANFRIHAPLEALANLMDEHRIAFDDMVSVRVGVSSATLNSVGSIVVPTDALGAQFSLRFALASAARLGKSSLPEHELEYLDDVAVCDFARRVEMYVDAEQEARIWTSLGAIVTIETAAGQTVSARVSAPPGTADNPLAVLEIEDKFRSLVDPVCGPDRAARIIDVVWRLEQVTPARDLWPDLVQTP